VGVMKLQQLSPDDWRLWRMVRLQALEEAPYAFGTSLLDWQGEGDREGRWRKRLDDVPFNVVAVVDGCPVAQVSGTDVDEQRSVELISMWVAPSARGTGIGGVLSDAVVAWAQAIGAQDVSLAVKGENSHAIALYERAGFVDRGVSADTPDERTMTRLLATS
jgi:RimJ/RimL family protein N-acetyltransferase